MYGLTMGIDWSVLWWKINMWCLKIKYTIWAERKDVPFDIGLSLIDLITNTAQDIKTLVSYLITNTAHGFVEMGLSLNDAGSVIWSQIEHSELYVYRDCTVTQWSDDKYSAWHYIKIEWLPIGCWLQGHFLT